MRKERRFMLKEWARRKGYTKVNRRFSGIWARYQRGVYGDFYGYITSTGRGKKIHTHTNRRDKREERAAAKTVTRQSIIKTAFQNIAAKLTGKAPTPSARSGLA